MVWAAISYYGLSYLVIFKDNMKSCEHGKVLGDLLLPFAAENLGERWVFLQDGPSVHRSNFTTSWLKRRNVTLLQWPAKSPDVNIIENLWGFIARLVMPMPGIF